ncbi:threonine-phosphate decarboxylase CobD [Alteriqipengyuania lutimaris]|uniref:threonine-phosphate decarboxylase n=1 Tax=Alteriqipengyuania lutimaris TaxID=1538146 RepID=A0A395LPB3_9SPHN|nr:threonine-phosphate decarboxylase CobD [Alteriqipengyuania lutimaris]MBB3033619.1 cobalamin biosynthetic protein CobC [Alteriqipengyuania lutimaris]RDS77384.1 threonine-phosphate decarboxylase [Alteriqipengyuania lutimaris]
MSGAFDWHGGRLDDACAHFGGTREEWLDLSTGINPCPWPVPGDLEPYWHALPDPSALARMEGMAAQYFGVDPSLCCAMPGSEIGLRLIAAILGLPGRYLEPSYRTHAAMFAQAHSVKAPRADDLANALVIANPNNPDGRVTSLATLRDWLALQEAAGGWLIVDEAFADTMPQISMAPEVDRARRLIVLRSFGKFFGLAGVRLGFAIAPSDVISALRDLLGDWPLSGAALAIGEHAYADSAWIDTTRAALAARAAQFDRMLSQHGMEPQGASPLFRLVRAESAGAQFDRLARHRILTRPFANRPDWLRFGVPADEAQMQRVARALGDG